ncbi:MAG: nucleoside recognition protein [Ignavibacteriales bacterium CG_4_9_14_3_um_filter_30_11]|nr:MAG: nucleoside recognition protein [Ignavibacteriales bacterium CG_4_9_14_3_um_filter_30_11]
MLNYVWIALLFLGIGAALTTDIIDNNQNKFHNNKRITVKVYFKDGIEKDLYIKINSDVTVSKNEFNKIFSKNINSDLTFNSVVTFDKDTTSAKANLIITDGMPDVVKSIAKASGKDNDINATIYFNNGNASIIFEKVSFINLKNVTNAALEYAGIAVNIALGLIGIMALWIGIMKVAEDAGLIKVIAKVVKPLTKWLFPNVPSDHPAMGSMIMNISANMLGLGNAATPFGLKAMEELEELNPKKGTATNAMCTFLAINTAGITLIPATAIAVRAAAGSSDPAIIIGTSLFASFCATIAGIFSAKLFEKFPLKKGEFKIWLKENSKFFTILFLLIAVVLIFSFTGFGKSVASTFSFINVSSFKTVIQLLSTLAIPLLIVIFLGYGLIKKVKVYEQFVEGAKEGFQIAIKIIPYLVAMLVAIGIFRAGGAMEWLKFVVQPVTDFIGMPVDALPMALMRPLSGSGSLGIMAEIISVHGPDSFIGILTSTFYGSTETTFYVLALYFGAVNIKKTRHALPAGLIADITGILAAVFIVRLLFV